MGSGHFLGYFLDSQFDPEIEVAIGPQIYRLHSHFAEKVNVQNIVTAPSTTGGKSERLSVPRWKKKVEYLRLSQGCKPALDLKCLTTGLGRTHRPATR